MNQVPPQKAADWSLTALLQRFLQSESKAGIILMLCTVISLVLANSAVGESYTHFWHINIAGMSLEHFINDALMAIFFLLVGLEIERQIYVGELRQIKAALLPIFAAIGGMFVPALIHYGFNGGTPYQDGFGIPMATDIAFALGVLLLLGNKVPVALKIFLVALAIIDDLGAIIVIAIFYSKGIAWTYLAAALAIEDFLFAAAFLCITPFDTATSRAFEAARSSAVVAAASPFATASRNLRTAVLIEEETDLLRRYAFSFVLIRLICDLIFAMRLELRL